MAVFDFPKFKSRRSVKTFFNELSEVYFGLNFA